ncbi:androgen-induced gene 1 protein-like isoform X2 [Vespula pensylvanica]|uniref:androgen-induced gene 1 protein-like isoform X2 n=1 Tax=Vespula pensylvanica TaxID=30213 RepID=UPI001CBA214E|nr:androgen-induced gene 1 protein-like isoform X2 [Vespula pensylvanica]XP_043683491.1 androgen-induced gene 1 protein-like isoform X2 [Vespula pensylvanica]XP_043683495.1 androgen-induced gene 1 protein-like isoform X2 [Vespula pensylvanica]XP_043683496.1 androgen-induced gene 1 protein-like isoform X2 [Vespula pensylvanica]XP_050867326.1 androgen-induced gene 1 protein-like isoform X1 [Vespula vulgaris]XP_050867329.1 androgen-induced gene 1 protein-like isoform X1 [Vespula vulgaris]XP_0508
MIQKMNSFIHIGMCAVYAYITIHASFLQSIPLLEELFSEFDPGILKFLTMWNVILQAVFFFICIVNDWYGTNAVSPKKPPFVRKLKDYVYATLSFPMAMFVGITFWSIMCVDRELVLPKALDPYFPWWLNHLMHTMIMVSAVIEMLLAPRKYPKRSRGLAGLLAFTLTYLIWMHVIYFMSGIWVYPVMEVLTPPLRIVFFVVLLAFVLILYFAGEMLNNLVWGNEQTKQHKSHSK